MICALVREASLSGNLATQLVAIGQPAFPKVFASCSLPAPSDEKLRSSLRILRKALFGVLNRTHRCGSSFREKGRCYFGNQLLFWTYRKAPRPLSRLLLCDEQRLWCVRKTRDWASISKQ